MTRVTGHQEENASESQIMMEDEGSGLIVLRQGLVPVPVALVPVT